MFHTTYNSFESRSNDHNKGKKRFTNGRESAMFRPGEEPESWQLGRKIKKEGKNN